MVIKRFEKHLETFGNIVGITIPTKKLGPLSKATVTEIRVDDKKSAWRLLIWPESIAMFEYRYKKFRPLSAVRSSGGIVVWEPPIDIDKAGKPVKTANDPDTIVLGEWVEYRKQSLFVREREDFVIRFRSKDGINATVKGYIKFLVWDVSAAISATYQFKVDPEKVIIDQFQNWAKNKDYFSGINGISFEKMDGADKFFEDLNDDIYATGVIVEDVELTEFIIEPNSKDIAEAQELKLKNELRKAAEKIESERKEIEGEGNKAKKLAENLAEEDLQKREAAVAAEKDKLLKVNETTQYTEMRKVDLENNVKLITKLMKYKGTVDETEVQKARELGKVTGTLIYHEKGSTDGSNFDDKLIESNIIAQTLNKKGGQK